MTPPISMKPASRLHASAQFRIAVKAETAFSNPPIRKSAEAQSRFSVDAELRLC